MNTENAESTESTNGPGTSNSPDGPGTPVAQAKRPQPRSWSIVWGVFVLVVCVYSAAQLLNPGSVDPTAWVIATTIGLGVLLLAVGIVVVVRGRR